MEDIYAIAKVFGKLQWSKTLKSTVCDHVPTCNQWSPSASPFICFSAKVRVCSVLLLLRFGITRSMQLHEFDLIGLLTVLLCSSHIRLFTFSQVTVNSLYRFGSESHTFEQMLNKTLQTDLILYAWGVLLEFHWNQVTNHYSACSLLAVLHKAWLFILHPDCC